MPVTNYPFRPVVSNNSMRPMLEVKYINPHADKHFSAWAIIDTRADHCVLPDSFAPMLGHNLEAGELVNVSGVGGASQGYRHVMQLEIENYCTEETMVSFLPNVRQPLIRVGSFLSNFKLTIDYPKQRFSLDFSEAEDPNSNPHSWPKP